MTSLLRCSICKSSALLQEYEGAEITCTGCGYVGCIESVYSLSSLKESLETDEDRKHREMEAYAAEMESNVDIADTLSQLSVRQLRSRRIRPA
jgi:transcription initiation factor TFIIIB Brf1 subunit/transcription initiation factor TFIIB